MAGVIAHLQIATAIQEKVQLSSQDLPWLYAGALGPDIGYFPDADTMMSDLAHYHNTADLLRAIIHHARSSNEQAFALGWLSHWLTDCRTHPLVNQSVGQLKGLESVTYEEDTIAHQQVEIGLDACLATGSEYKLIEKLPVFTSENLEFLSSAYLSTYGITLTGEALVAAFKSVRTNGSKVAQVAILQAVLWRLLRLPAPLIKTLLLDFLPLKVLCKVIGTKAPHYGLGTLVRPTAQFLEGWKLALKPLARESLVHWENNADTLMNTNLDTGVLQEQDTYGLRQEILELIVV